MNLLIDIISKIVPHGVMWRSAMFRKDRRPSTVRIISATRLSEGEFWHRSALGQSLLPWTDDPRISWCVRYSNTEGLSTVYNQYLEDKSNLSDIVVFVHDDVWLRDPQWIDKLCEAVRQFDLVGVAGNRRRSPHQPAWLFKSRVAGQFVWDHGHLSGQIMHGAGPSGQPQFFGTTPTECELLDGVFLAGYLPALRQTQVSFDPQFDFHFYDMDFCRAARRKGLRLGTWPIILTHQSSGSFGSATWTQMWSRYIKKWKK